MKSAFRGAATPRRAHRFACDRGCAPADKDLIRPENMIALRASDAPRAFGYTQAAGSLSNALASLELSRRYLAAIEAGATGAALAAFFSPDVEQIEFPNRLMPTGARRDLAALLDAAVRGQQVLQHQRYQVERAFTDGPIVILELLWVGVLAIPFGSLTAGAEMRAHFVVVLEIDGGRIVRQRNYDCFDPF